MKNILLILCLLTAQSMLSQTNINSMNNPRPLVDIQSKQDGIKASPYHINITTKILYNAKPDGYYITFTKSFISESVANVEAMMNRTTDQVMAQAKELNIAPEEVHIDLVALDPIFGLNSNSRDSNGTQPIGYKITENISFNVPDIKVMRALYQICLQHDIYDLISVQAYLLDSKPILDSLNKKSIEILEMKKEFSTDIGWEFKGGKMSFQKNKKVFYPNMRYLKSLVRNNNHDIYQHHLSQNTSIEHTRSLQYTQHYTFDYQHADFIFNAGLQTPSIQFFYEVLYSYQKINKEEEERKKLEKEEKQKKTNTLYRIDADGKLQEVKID